MYRNFCGKNAMAILFKIIRNGNDFSCRAENGPTFFVGRRVPYEGNIGLYNVFAGSKLEKANYLAQDYRGAFGFWADFIEPTAICEGRNFLTLNTYDRAAFTFGFAQFAAHVPNGDFVLYFRSMLALPQARDYFPNLSVVGGRICELDIGGHARPLESDGSTSLLMGYLNPDLSEVQDAEVVAAGKLIHWTSNVPAARQIQVDHMIATFQRLVRRADQRVGLHGRSADLCCVIADILHQGRGGKMTWPLIDAALKSANPLPKLIAIGAPRYKERRSELQKQVKARPAFAQLTWDRPSAAFV